MSDNHEPISEAGADRRRFLATAGKFAVVVPPAMTVLLSTTMSSPAIAQSGGVHPGGGDDDDTVPILGLVPVGLAAGGIPAAGGVLPVAAAAPAPMALAAGPVPTGAPLGGVAGAQSPQNPQVGGVSPAEGTPIQRAGERG